MGHGLGGRLGLNLCRGDRWEGVVCYVCRRERRRRNVRGWMFSERKSVRVVVVVCVGHVYHCYYNNIY